MASADTIAAIATAPGRAGIGIVRLSGPDLQPLMRALLGASLPPRQALLRNFLDASGRALDRGIAIYYPAPRSYTGEDVLELHGHGGQALLKLVLARCLDLGARLAEPGEYTRRAFLNDKLDLAQAESVADLIDASSAQAARSAMRSLQGEFSAAVRELVAALTELRALVEAGLDFPDEELEVPARDALRVRLRGLRENLERVLAASRQGSLLREGLHLVLAGRPNVGKSSLLNRLAGEELAIVTEIPGTTRDLVRQPIDLEGVPLNLIDTAGLRVATDVVEQRGIDKTKEAIANADLLVLVTDAAAGDAPLEVLPEPEPTGVANIPTIVVRNKIDLTGEAAVVTRDDGKPTVSISAKTGAGVDLLKQEILRQAGWDFGAEGLFLARERHLRALN
ncbi:MAG TPA: tRNA uridine-5-carboxymethylaminomethyl(34) synthesis GTPase MnmE, partial [Burkholderiales bacterium]|nr:tRNA uridine-5-carboxymethylaminomethyl(34) synthesis GTPase MnmE [Burkholderiales bacterium]